MFLVSPRALREKGIVGMNKRNVELISKNNDRRLYPLVDDKLKTKDILIEAGISTPTLLGAVKTQGNVRELEEFLKTQPPFVMKPAKGSGGKGILVVSSHGEGKYTKPNGVSLDISEIKNHASNTLSGLFSLGGCNDVAVLEEMIDFSSEFDGFSYQGVPDIRVIVYKGYPVMAMTRLSTSDSDGKANLHQGAVGVGIDIARGCALKAVQFGRPVSVHPDTGKELSLFKVPEWRGFLELASRCYDITGLGYLGVDIVLDQQKGPMILELNARPGLAIQVANGMGMQTRIDLVEAEVGQQRSALDRVSFILDELSK